MDSLPSNAQEQLLNELFTTSASGGGGGIGLSLMRHTIGQSDLSPEGEYSFETARSVEHWEVVKTALLHMTFRAEFSVLSVCGVSYMKPKTMQMRVTPPWAK